MRELAGRVSGRAFRGVAIAIACVALVGAIVLIARRSEAPDPVRELVAARAALAIGNYSAARNHAQVSLLADPTPAAHLELARAYLLLGDGVPAEGEIQRAVTSGTPVETVRHLLAHADWLQGETDTALAEAARATPRFAGYAQRIRGRALADQGDYRAAIDILTGVVAANPRDAAGWTDLGRVRIRAGDTAGATYAAVRATALDPANLDALTLRGELVRDQYGLNAALPWFEAALKRDAYFHPALIEYAATLGDLGRYADMLDVSRRALAARPGSLQALYLQAVMAARAGRFDLAAKMLARTGGAIDDVPGVLLLAGSLDYAAGQYQQAIGRWRVLSARQPMNLAVRRLLGAALLRAGDARGALDILRPIALRADADSYTLGTVARAFEATGETDWAARFRDRAARSGGVGGAAPFGTDDGVAVLAVAAADHPANTAAAVDYVRGLIEAGDPAAALARAVAVARVSSGAPAAHLLVGDTLATTGRYPEALQAYARAAGLQFDAPTLLRIVEASERTGRRRFGANALALYLDQNPESVVARRVAANLQLGARDWDAAIDTLEGLRTTIGNRDAILLAQLALAYAGAGDAATARSFGRVAYSLAPMNAIVADAYGRALYQTGANAAALQLATKATVLAPARADMRWHLAQVLAELGRTAPARAAIQTALSDPGFTDRAPANALLRALPRG